MKRCVSLLLWAALLLGLGACGAGTASREDGSLRVVATIFPLYDWARTVAGDDPHADVQLLVKNGVDLHSFQPTTADMLAIKNCDLFIYVGGESDGWVDDALKEAVNPDMRVINLLDALGGAVKEEEAVEGMEAEEEEEEEEGPEYDEHVWLSLRNAQTLCGQIADALSALDPDHADAYAENLQAYDAELAALDAAYADAVAAAPLDTVLFGDRFPFRYLTEDYGLDYYAAFSGCSAETEASFETVAFLAEKLRELDLPAVLIIEGSDGKLARTVIDGSGRGDLPVLALNSMQGVSASEIEAGQTYLGAMENNLAVLKQALGG